MTTLLTDALQSAILCATAIQLGFLRRVVRTRAGCLCAKGRWNPDCPVHPPTEAAA